MAEDVNETNQVPKTREVFVNQERKTRAHKLGPKKLFENEGGGESRGGPAYSDPTGGRGKRYHRARTLVETSQGRRLLSCDARLHLEKLKAKRQAIENREQLNLEAIKGELDALDRERKWIEFQARQRFEAEKWEEEFVRKKDEKVASSEYQTEDYDYDYEPL